MKKIITFTTPVCICLLFGCAFSPTQPELQNEFRYTVSRASPGANALAISLAIHRREAVDSIHLLAPPIYADNPWVEQTSLNFHALTITDAANRNIPCTLDSVAVGLYNSLRISFPCSDTLTTVRYIVTFNYIDTIPGPVPHLDNTAGYWQGAYVFTIPVTGTDIADIWRTPYDLSVTYNLDNTNVLYGDPLPTVYFRTPYELLFSTNALNGNVLAQGESNGQEYRFVGVADTGQISQSFLSKATQHMEILLQDIMSVFEPITAAPMSVFLGINNAGGLEGMYGFSIIMLCDDDSRGWFPMILAHETIHFWIGLRVGDYEDPWWKEGTTSYLGYVFALRNNLCTDYFITSRLLADLSGDAGVNTYALADPEVRKRIYASVDNCESLVYNKGAQVTMLMDRVIRETSGNTTSIIAILGEFVKKYDGRAFRRNEYISFIEKLSGSDVSDIFNTYVITKGAIPVPVLEENCTALINLGAFGSLSQRESSRSTKSREIPLRW